LANINFVVKLGLSKIYCTVWNGDPVGQNRHKSTLGLVAWYRDPAKRSWKLAFRPAAKLNIKFDGQMRIDIDCHLHELDSYASSKTSTSCFLFLKVMKV